MIGEVLGEAVGVAISPIPIIAVVLMLASARGKSNSLAFLVGWLVGLGLVGVVVLAVADPAGASTDSGPATWVGWLFLVLGAFAVLAGIRMFNKRPRGDDEPPMPKWMAAMDQFTTLKSLGTGFLLAALNPKNLTLTLAASAAIASAGLSSSDEYITLALFVLVGTLGLAIPIGIYFFGGDKAAGTLADLRHWLAINNAAIMSVLFVVIGAKIFGGGLGIVMV
ncbi:MAG TPA: GAP family protein [Acidimicrobiia bacterium]